MELDIYPIELPTGGYELRVIGRNGSITRVVKHYPWFALYARSPINIADLRRIFESSKRLKPFANEIVEIEYVGDGIPIIPVYGMESFMLRPNSQFKVHKVKMKRKDYIRKVAENLARSGEDIHTGLYNITYEVRAGFDIDLKIGHTKAPILYQPLSDMEALFEEVIERAQKLKILAFDIEVAPKRPGQFPVPNDHIISIQFASFTIEDDVFDKRWASDHVIRLVAERKSTEESRELVAKFLRHVDSIKPDIIIGYNSTGFDVKYMRPFLQNPTTLANLYFFYRTSRIHPHLDLYSVRKSMGSSLGVRSQAAMSLVDVVREVAKGIPGLDWLWSSELIEAEERLDHTKLVVEWRRGTPLFYNYITADVYLTVILGKLWITTVLLVGALLQIPLTMFNRLNSGQLSEYNIVHFLEKLGFYPVIMRRLFEFRKISGASVKVVEGIAPPEWAKTFARGKVYAASYGKFNYIVEGDFSQLYPTLMANHTIDPTSIRYKKLVELKDDGTSIVASRTFGDSLIQGTRIGNERSSWIALGKKPSKSADYMVPKYILEAVPLYGPVSWLFYKMYTARKVTKKLKKRAEREGRPELLAADQAIKIINNASYGGMSKRRGFINQAVSSYIFWTTLKLLYDVIEYAESKGYKVLYGDTDSLFIQCNVEEARKLFPSASEIDSCRRWMEEKVLPELESFVRKRYGVEFSIKLEDAFGFCVYPKQKGKTTPSKKSYICGDVNGKLTVKIFKGDFYKALAPAAIKDHLKEFYERILEENATTVDKVVKIMREFLERAPPHKLFVKKTIDSFEKEDYDIGEEEEHSEPAPQVITEDEDVDEEEEDKEKNNTVKVSNLIKLNRAWHFGALHLTYALGYPGVEKHEERIVRGRVKRVRFFVDAKKVTEHGSIIVNFLPGDNPKRFMVYVGEKDGKIRVHSVKVIKVSEVGIKREDEKIITGYVVEEVYEELLLTKSEVVELAIASMRKYIIDDIAQKLLPALTQVSLKNFIKTQGA